MPKYSFVVEASIAMITDVEAKTLEDAIEIAKHREVKPRCYSCSSGANKNWLAMDISEIVPVNESLADVYVDGDSELDIFKVAKEMW